MSHYSIPLLSKLDQLKDWLDQLFQGRFQRLIALRACIFVMSGFEYPTGYFAFAGGTSGF